MKGDCKCGLEFTLFVLDVPQEGKNLQIIGTYAGDFQLIQELTTTRRLSGESKLQMSQKLVYSKAARVFYENLFETPIIQQLHGNYKQVSMSSLRKIRSDLNSRYRTSRNLFDDLFNLSEQFVKDVGSNLSGIQGYLHNIKDKPFQFYIFCHNQIELTAALLANKKIQVFMYFDSTGGVILNPFQNKLKPQNVDSENKTAEQKSIH